MFVSVGLDFVDLEGFSNFNDSVIPTEQEFLTPNPPRLNGDIK